MPRVDTFDLTVRPRAPDASPVVSGSITAEFGNKTEKADVREGEADFKGIARTFWGKSVRIRADIRGYSSEPQFLLVTSNAIDFSLQEPAARIIQGLLNPTPAAPRSVRVCILDEAGETLQLCTNARTDGHFEFSIHSEASSRIRIGVCISGKLAFDDFAKFGSGETIIGTTLRRSRCPF